MAFPRILADRRLLAALIVAAVIGALAASGAPDLLSIDTLRAHRQTLKALVAAQPIAAAIGYVCVYVAAATCAMPGVIWLTVIGGFLFGWAPGAALTVVAATAGAVVAFTLARALFGADALARLGPRAARMADALKRNAGSYLVALRLMPFVPYVLVNVVPAFSGVPTRIFALATLFGVVPGTVAFSIAGAGLGRMLDQPGAPTPAGLVAPEVWIALAVLAALALVAGPLRRRLDRRSGAPTHES